MKGLRARGLGLTAALALSYVVSGSSRTPAQDQPPQPTFRTEANYVRVDVFPTRNGEPIADLRQEDFDVLENGTPQKIDQFEHIVIRATGPQDVRIEPNTVRESRAMLENSRARVFVLFLDVGHVEVEASHRIRQPLIDALDHLIGPDDLVGVMTSDMSPADITFARRTTTIAGMLTRHWTWGERGQLNPKDPQEQQYQACYPGSPPLKCPDGTLDDDRGIADEMIRRRREKLTMDALNNLVVYLRGVREERKAVLAITDGWLLFRPNSGLARKLNCQIPSGNNISVDPRTGKLTSRDLPNTLNATSCDRDRMSFANMDNDQDFKNLLDAANRSNTSFYPIDPRGLVAFDTQIAEPTTGLPPPGSTTITPPSIDQAMLRGRINTLRTLAEATDGLAIVDSNDLAKGLKRVVDDLSSYYLLGYYSTGRLDGKFHPITVRVKRPGVQVRARRGYLAATPATAATSARAGGSRGADAAPLPGSPGAEAAANAHAIDAVISLLTAYTRDVPLRLQIAAGWKPGDITSAAMWVVGEIGSVATVGDSWKDGFEATATLTTSTDATVASGQVTVPRGARTFRVALTPSRALVPGDYVLRVGASAGPASIPSRNTLHLAIPDAPGSVGAIFLRRGQTTGNKDVPTADLRFRRGEQVRVEVPTASSDPVAARLLDRTGKPLAVPVTAALRDDADGSRWRTAQLALAPLAPGDYVIELTSGGERMLSAFRVVP